MNIMLGAWRERACVKRASANIKYYKFYYAAPFLLCSVCRNTGARAVTVTKAVCLSVRMCMYT